MIEIKINDEIYTEEQYKKDYVRMMDSLRQDHLGEKNCGGVDCDDCPLFKKLVVIKWKEIYIIEA